MYSEKVLPKDLIETPIGANPNSVRVYERIDVDREVELLDMINLCNNTKTEKGFLTDTEKADLDNAAMWIAAGNSGYIYRLSEKYVGGHVNHEDAFSTALIGFWQITSKYNVATTRRRLRRRIARDEGANREPTNTEIHMSFLAYMRKAIRSEMRTIGYERLSVRIPAAVSEGVVKYRRGDIELDELGKKAIRFAITESFDPRQRLESTPGVDILPAHRGAPVDLAENDNHFGDPEATAYDNARNRALSEALNELPEREQEILRLRYYGLDNGEVMPLEEVGLMKGLTAQRIRQIEAKARASLRHPHKVNNLRSFADGGRIEYSQWDQDDIENAAKPMLDYIRIKQERQIRPIINSAIKSKSLSELRETISLISQLSLKAKRELIDYIQEDDLDWDQLDEEGAQSLNPALSSYPTLGRHRDMGQLRGAKHATPHQANIRPADLEALSQFIESVKEIQQSIRYAGTSEPIHQPTDLGWLKKLAAKSEAIGWYSVRMHLAHIALEKDAVNVAKANGL